MNRRWDRDAQRRYAEEMTKEPEVVYDEDDLPDPAKKPWFKCQICGHLHSMSSNTACKAACCHANAQPVTVQRCGVCSGSGGYKDQWDEDRRAEMVRCDTCKGKGVVEVSKPG